MTEHPRLVDEPRGLHVVIDEQAALRRVATLVCQGVAPAAIFSAVSDEAEALFDCGAGVTRFEAEPQAIVFVGVSKRIDVPVGTRWEFEDGMASVEVYRTHRAAHVEGRDWSTGSSPLATTARRVGLVASLATPIIVDGCLWGAMNLWSTAEPFAPGASERLEDFTTLVATAIANAESRQALLVLASEQAALRRVATLVARRVPYDELFAAVSDETGRLFGSDNAAVVKLEHEPLGFVVVGIGNGVAGIPLGSRSTLDEGLAVTAAYRTGRPARVDARDLSAVNGTIGEAGRRMGIVCAVASPIIVRDRVWGMISLSGTQPLSPDTEERLERFSELVGIAIGRADAREAERLLADEQAALRRVATLVAQGVPAAEMFSAVCEEIANLFCEDIAAVLKFDSAAAAVTFVGLTTNVWGPEIGARFQLSDETPSGRVYATGRSARIDAQDWSKARSPIGQLMDRARIVSAVASPIIVEGRVWGTTCAQSTTKLLPLDAEERLERFSELVGIAIGSAEAQHAERLLADEQAALRRVATLVAQGVPAAEMFSAVCEEIARLFGADLAAVGKFHREAAAVTFIGLTKNVEGVEIGSRIELSDETPTGRVYATGQSARIDGSDWSKAQSPIGQLAGRFGIASCVASPIIVEGRVWGTTSVLSSTKPLPWDTERRLERFSELVATAIANAESRSELAASRRRIVAASDEARRRIERNLHDGTQQRLVSLALAARAAEADVPTDLPNTRSELSQIATGLADAVVELQEITRGVHPANLEQRGLGAALRTLARRSPIPVELDIAIQGRLPGPVEVAGYYVASETLANAAKHARATAIQVALARRDDCVVVSICDDGIGGADPASGSGLVGLTDRVEALGGSLEVQSPSGQGTRVTALLPLDSEFDVLFA